MVTLDVSALAFEIIQQPMTARAYGHKIEEGIFIANRFVMQVMHVERIG